MWRTGRLEAHLTLGLDDTCELTHNLVVSLRALAIKHAAHTSFVDFCDLHLPASLLEAVFELISLRHNMPRKCQPSARLSASGAAGLNVLDG